MTRYKFGFFVARGIISVAVFLVAATSFFIVWPAVGASSQKTIADTSSRRTQIWPIITPIKFTDYLKLRRKVILPGVLEAKRFTAPCSGSGVSGGFYVPTKRNPFATGTAQVIPTDPAIVTLCRDTSGKLGDIAATRIGSVRVMVQPKSVQGSAVKRIPFTIKARITAGQHYWLVVEPGWRANAASMSSIKRSIEILAGSQEVASSQAIHRVILSLSAYYHPPARRNPSLEIADSDKTHPILMDLAVVQK